jgi:hypothetical protein
MGSWAWIVSKAPFRLETPYFYAPQGPLQPSAENKAMCSIIPDKRLSKYLRLTY